jgi:hypothetical protein
MLTAWIPDIEQAWPERGEKRRVMRKHGHFAFRARHNHLLDFARHKQAFGRDQLELEGVRHA